MKRMMILLAGICYALTGLGQTDSTKSESDTIRIGNIIIIKKGKEGRDSSDRDDDVRIERRKNYKPSNVSTNWWIVDLGVSQFSDNTDYLSASAQQFAPGATEDWFELRNGKSINVNIWAFMQRLNMIKHVVNLKYGLGVELNNYRYENSRRLKYLTNPTKIIIDSSTSYSKNKLAADYVTVPMMLNFNFTPNRKRGFGFSVGGSVGYLYSSRQKTITASAGKQKERDDFDLNKWKLSYIAEISLGPVRLYGSYATKSMFEKGLDHTPYNVGFRLSNW